MGSKGDASESSASHANKPTFPSTSTFMSYDMRWLPRFASRRRTRSQISRFIASSYSFARQWKHLHRSGYLPR